MNVRQLYDELDMRIPRALSAPWDNDGLMCCPEPEREVKKIFYSLDVTEEAAATAIKEGYDVIITHHPMIFKPIKGIVDPMYVKLVKAGISVFSFHTRFDALEGGVNDVLACLCDADVVERGFCEGMGTVGEFENGISPEELAENIKDILASPCVDLVSAGKECRKIAFLGGDGGKSAIDAALAAGADALVTGSAGYNAMLDAQRAGLTVVTAGHFFTEMPSMSALAAIVAQYCDAEETFFECNTIRRV